MVAVVACVEVWTRSDAARRRVPRARRGRGGGRRRTDGTLRAVGLLLRGCCPARGCIRTPRCASRRASPAARDIDDVKRATKRAERSMLEKSARVGRGSEAAATRADTRSGMLMRRASQSVAPKRRAAEARTDSVITTTTRSRSSRLSHHRGSLNSLNSSGRDLSHLQLLCWVLRVHPPHHLGEVFYAWHGLSAVTGSCPAASEGRRGTWSSSGRAGLSGDHEAKKKKPSRHKKQCDIIATNIRHAF